MNIDLFGITWSKFQYIYFLPILFIIAVLIFARYKKTKALVSALGEKSLINFSWNKSTLKLIFQIIGFIFLFIALLGPQWGKKDDLVKQKGRDVFIALDVSRSMLAQDLLPNRLEFAKNKIRNLINLLETDRVGLILFSGSAYVHCPLTQDKQAFNMLLDACDTESISSGTTALDEAIKISMKQFSNSNAKNKLLVFLTDGEDFSSNLNDVKSEAKDNNMHIFSLGIGTAEGAPVPLIDEHGKQAGYQLDDQGKVVITCLNNTMLKALSEECFGVYIKSTEDNSDIKSIVNKLSAFEKHNFEDKHLNGLKERYPYFVFAGFISFAIAWIL